MLSAALVACSNALSTDSSRSAPAVVRAGMIRAVTGRIDVGIRGAAVLVDDDAVRALEARGLRELVRGRHADADHDDVRWILRAVLADHGAHPSG